VNKKKSCELTGTSTMTADTSNSKVTSKISNLTCQFCEEIFKRKYNKEKHEKHCKENNRIRRLEIKLGIKYTSNNGIMCNFCNKAYNRTDNLQRHLKICKSRVEYEKKLEIELSKGVTINNNFNVVNILQSTINKFGEESTDHISNSFLRKTLGTLGFPLSKAVSTVAKKIYFKDNIPENQTLKITNIRSNWAKVSNGSSFELKGLKESVDGVRNKVTDLYIERQEELPDYFEPVSKHIEILDDLNNQNYIPKNSEEKELQKEALKLKLEIERELISCLYNTQKLIGF
jgi:hypothetical protein